jgi:choline dehydrogenase-like flavoprotein
MLIDGRTIPADTVIDTDVCIVGAGAAGISLARALGGESCRVVLLESGTAWPRPKTQALCRGRNVGREYFALDGCRVRTFGGSTQRWGGWCRALDTDDFTARPWISESGWPFDRDELDPYYREARKLSQLVVTRGDIDHGPPIPRRPRLAVPPELQTIMYEFSPPTRFGQAYGGDLARADNVTVYLSSNVVALDGAAHGAPVTVAVVRTLEGREWRVRSRVYVLATGGIENPRILLASRNTRPEGLGNEHDLVGRYFMEHVHVRLGCFVPARGDANLSLYVQGRRSVRRPLGALTLTTAERRARHLYGFSAALFPPRQRAVANVLHHQAQLQPPWMMHGVSIARAGVLGFGLRVIDKLVRTALEAGSGRVFLHTEPQTTPHATPVVYEIMGRGEQTPLRDSRVTILPERDRLGMPIVQLDWRVNPADLRNIRESLEVIGRGLAACGAGRVYLPDDPDAAWAERIMGSWHHMGTTRMHPDPRHGVVNADGRMHSAPNVFVTGSSVFPTGGFANPTLTIVALALRMKDTVLKDLRVPVLDTTPPAPPGQVRALPTTLS